MIGVSVKLSHKDIVQEFFELFKTAWEFARPETHYDVMICSLSDLSEKENADLVIVYSTEFPPDQTWANNAKIDCQTGRNLVFGRDRLPIYGSSLTFPGFSKDLVDEVTQAPAIFTIRKKRTKPFCGLAMIYGRRLSICSFAVSRNNMRGFRLSKYISSCYVLSYATII